MWKATHFRMQIMMFLAKHRSIVNNIKGNIIDSVAKTTIIFLTVSSQSSITVLVFRYVANRIENYI